MTTNDDVSAWIDSLKKGSDEAAQRIWQRYYDRLVRLARRRLESSPRRVADEEDVVVDAFDSFCRAAKQNRWPQLNDRSDLWKLLITITARKANARLTKERAKKRGEGAVRGESVFNRVGDASQVQGLAGICGDAPSPELAAMVTETYEGLLAALDDEVLRTVALYKFQGFTNEEIAQKMNCVTRTVTRKLERIRAKWDRAVAD